ncbi:MAG TPA: ABC transporter permease [Bdellovibrionales bacterium]|nr:ABC transporter permease [Bdellovibrionales bacterium]
MLILKRTLFYASLLSIWQLIVMLEIWPDYVVPSPSAVFGAVYQGFTEGHFGPGILSSLKRLLIGYGVSVVFGAIMGAALAASKSLEETAGSLFLGLQTLPSVCWLPLALLWFGLTDTAIIFVIVMGSVLSITTGVMTAMKQVPVIWIQASKTLGARGLNLYLRVMLPAAFPAIVEGLRQGWSFAWRSLMAGELLFVTVGLGHLLNVGRELNDMAQVVGVMGVIVAIGLLADRLIFAFADRYISKRWGFRRA